MNTFIVYAVTFLSCCLTLGDLESKNTFEQHITQTTINNSPVVLIIEKLSETSYNLMATIDVKNDDETKMKMCAEDFETLLNLSFENNNYINMDKAVVEAFRSCANADSTNPPPISTVRVNTIIHLTKAGEASSQFSLNGSAACTLSDFCEGNDPNFKLNYLNGEMTVISSYPAMIYSTN